MASYQLDQTQLPPLVDPNELDKSAVIIETVEDERSDTPTDIKDVSQDDWVYPYPTSFKISEHPTDEVRTLKVAYTSLTHDDSL